MSSEVVVSGGGGGNFPPRLIYEAVCLNPPLTRRPRSFAANQPEVNRCKVGRAAPAART